MLVQVAPSLNIFEPLTYAYTGAAGEIKPGTRVVIPLANRAVAGWIVREQGQSDYSGKVKDIIGVVEDDYVPSEPFLAFCRSVSSLYFVSPAVLLDHSLSPRRKSLNNLCFKREKKVEKVGKYSLRELQSLCGNGPLRLFYRGTSPVEKIPDPDQTRQGVSENRFLLAYRREQHYRKIIREHLERGRSVLVVVPDNLTASFIAAEIPGVDVYNSSVKPVEREKTWNQYRQGKVGVVVGGLSAVLLPLWNLGAVICERAGSFLYKESRFSDFNVHTLAGIRAESEKVPFIEGYSTLTVGAAHGVGKGEVQVEDKREKNNIEMNVRMLKRGEKRIPASLVEAMKAYFIQEKKILVVLNKKHSHHYLFCVKCKRIAKCPSCRGILKVEEDFKVSCLSCDYRGSDSRYCDKCSGEWQFIEDISMASLKDRVEREVVEKGLLTVSAENFKDFAYLMGKVKGAKIVISTPAILHSYFEGIFDAVIYVRPESLFNMDGYDAAEEIFSMVSDVKELVKEGGAIDIFSTFHFHYALQMVQDEEGFWDRELKYRRWFRLPPYFYVYHLEVRDKDIRKLAAEMRTIYRQYRETFHIEPPYLVSRKKIHGFFRGKMVLHTHPAPLMESGLLRKRSLKITLFAV